MRKVLVLCTEIMKEQILFFDSYHFLNWKALTLFNLLFLNKLVANFKVDKRRK
jgi:hypothetical protein